MSRELRKEVVYSKLRQLKDSVQYVKEFLPSDFKLLESRRDSNALYKEAEVAIQLVIDICAVINSDIGKKSPSDEDSIIVFVEEEGVISKAISKKIISMKGFRNLLVHRYVEIDNKTAFENIQSGLIDFESFIKEIEEFLKNYKKDNSKNKR